MILRKGCCLLILSILLVSCDRPSVPVLAPEYLYDRRGQDLIGSSIDENHATISLLYGNRQALIAASAVPVRRLSGAQYTLVTWKQKQMPAWYGTNMNGEIAAVERLEIFSSRDGQLNINYRLKRRRSSAASFVLSAPEDRIKFIMRQRLAVMP